MAGARPRPISLPGRSREADFVFQKHSANPLAALLSGLTAGNVRARREDLEDSRRAEDFRFRRKQFEDLRAERQAERKARRKEREEDRRHQRGREKASDERAQERHDIAVDTNKRVATAAAASEARARLAARDKLATEQREIAAILKGIQGHVRTTDPRVQRLEQKLFKMGADIQKLDRGINWEAIMLDPVENDSPKAIKGVIESEADRAKALRKKVEEGRKKNLSPEQQAEVDAAEIMAVDIEKNNVLRTQSLAKAEDRVRAEGEARVKADRDAREARRVAERDDDAKRRTREKNLARRQKELKERREDQDDFEEDQRRASKASAAKADTDLSNLLKDPISGNQAPLTKETAKKAAKGQLLSAANSDQVKEDQLEIILVELLRRKVIDEDDVDRIASKHGFD